MKSTIKIKDTIGNNDLLRSKKIAFLCSRKISSQAVLKCYDWAIQQRESGNCVISGFHSQIEKDVFHYLAKGDQPIILALPRGLKKRWEPEIKELLKTDRFLIISPFEESVTRITQKTASIRNQMMIELADEVVVGYMDPGGGLYELLNTSDKSISLLEDFTK